VAAHLANLIRGGVLNVSQFVRAVVESSGHEVLFHVALEGKDLGRLFNGHLVVGENRKGQMSVCLVAEILGKDALQILTLFPHEATILAGHFEIFLMQKSNT